MIPGISIQQPWCWLIANGYKGVENRSWENRSCLGRTVFLHAGWNFDNDGLFTVRELILEHGLDIQLPREYPRGGFVGLVRFSDVRKHELYESDPWAVPGAYGYVVEKAMPLPLIKSKGALGFFPVDKNVVRIVKDLLSLRETMPDLNLSTLMPIDPRKPR